MLKIHRGSTEARLAASLDDGTDILHAARWYVIEEGLKHVDVRLRHEARGVGCYLLPCEG